MWDLISGLKALRENSVQIFLLPIWSLDVLKRIVKIFPKRLLDKEIKKPELKFNPGLGLIDLWTTGSWMLSWTEGKWWHIQLRSAQTAKYYLILQCSFLVNPLNLDSWSFNPLTPRSDWCKTSPYKYIYIIQQTGNENIQTYLVEAAI